jgi:hypothetical protein
MIEGLQRQVFGAHLGETAHPRQLAHHLYRYPTPQ